MPASAAQLAAAMEPAFLLAMRHCPVRDAAHHFRSLPVSPSPAPDVFPELSNSGSLPGKAGGSPVHMDTGPPPRSISKGSRLNWGSPSGVVERLRHSNKWNSKNPYRLDHPRVPQRLADAQANLKNAPELQDDLNKLNLEGWAKILVRPTTARTQLEQLKLRELPPR